MKTGPELLDEIAANASKAIDEVMRRDPATLLHGERTEFIEALRADRALFIKSEERKAAKKRGEAEEENDDD